MEGTYFHLYDINDQNDKSGPVRRAAGPGREFQFRGSDLKVFRVSYVLIGFYSLLNFDMSATKISEGYKKHGILGHRDMR